MLKLMKLYYHTILISRHIRFEAICENVASYLCQILDVSYVGILQGAKSNALVSICRSMIDHN